MGRVILFMLLATMPALARAQADISKAWCLPGLDNSQATASPIESGVTRNGAWARWYCTERATGRRQRNLYVGTVPELSKVGSRVQTIIGAADPLASLQTLPRRITVLPLSDPSLAAILADVK